MQPALVERARRGDQDAFAALATASVDRSYALAYRISGIRISPGRDAAGAPQRVAAPADRSGTPSLFEAWLHRLVVRAATPRPGGTVAGPNGSA